MRLRRATTLLFLLFACAGAGDPACGAQGSHAAIAAPAAAAAAASTVYTASTASAGYAGSATSTARVSPHSSRPSRGASARAAAEAQSLLAPADAFRIPCENADGALLFRARLTAGGGLDTTGLLVLDTGAGYLSLSPSLIRRMNLSDRPVDPMTFASKPLQRITIGEFSQDVVGPVLGVDTQVIEQAIDRHVLGLLGYEPLASFAVRIDYRVDTLALIPIRRDGISAGPPRRGTATDLAASNASFLLARNSSREALGGSLGTGSVALPFEILGDGKIVVTGRAGVAGDGNGVPLTLILDTGATKTVLFTKAIERSRGSRGWPQLRGLSAPTLYGSENTYVTRIPRLAVTGAGEAASADGVDAAVMESDLETALSQAVERPVDGLLGFSFLRRFRITIDYPHRILWLEPVAVGRDQRRDEYSHVGVQIERRDGVLRVVAVAENSPAAKAGIVAGDELGGIDGADASSLDVIEASRRLEGPSGSRVTLRIRRGSELHTYRLTRRTLL